MYAKILSVVLFLVVLFVVFTPDTNAKSVYAITDHGYPYRPAKITSYDINNTGIDMNITYTSDFLTGASRGPVGITVDSNERYVFISHEGSGIIELLDARTMVREANVSAPSAYNLAGIVFDNKNNKLYAADRSDLRIFVYSWNPANKTLSLDREVIITDQSGQGELCCDDDGESFTACGLALDEGRDLLYVTFINGHSAIRNVVYSYSTEDWTFQKRIEIEVNNINRDAVAVAVYSDGRNANYLYTGSYTWGVTQPYLIRTDLSDTNNPNSYVEKNIGASAVGVAADQQTGLVYVTASDNTIKVFDNAAWPSDSCYDTGEPNITGPAGICVPHTLPIPSGCEVTLTKTDDVNGCIEPNNFINYNICYSTTCDINDVNIIDYLPEYCDFNSCTGGGVYDSNFHTVRWSLDNLDANDSNCFTLKVKVADYAIGGSTLTNTVKMYIGQYLFKTTTEDTNICCDYPIVYVDANRPADGNGRSWQTAYKELRNALTNARDGNCGCADKIWVAKGTYKPTDANDPSPYEKTFQMINGIDVYGHFAGNETSIDQRNLADSNNKTILTGDIDDNNTSDVQYVITAANSRLDGFTVKKGSNSGIYSNACSPTIENCVVKYNNTYGIYCINGANTTITNTFINNNSTGILCQGSNSYVNINKCTVSTNTCNFYANGCMANVTDSIFSHAYDPVYTCTSIFASYANLTIERCDISDNQGRGIGCGGGTSVSIKQCNVQRNTTFGIIVDDNDIVMSSVISDNGDMGVYTSGNSQIAGNLIYSNAHYGIRCDSTTAEIRNNTIVRNGYFGIYSYEDPNIKNNIIWDNNIGSFGGGGSFTKVNYNCIQNYTGGGTNINLNPQFVNANNYHLKKISPCIDRGDPNFNSSAETDIDGENRIMDGNNDGNLRVDIGADEFYWSPADFDKNAIVNFIDYASLARSWQLADANKSLDDDNDVDVYDLLIFCEDWLWTPDRLSEFDVGGEGAYFAQGGSGGEKSAFAEVSADELMMSMASEQLLLLAGEGETASIYLLSDVNEPNSGDEVTIQVYSDVPLFAMGLGITVTGDANITDAMSTADCNQFGWDPSWPTDPLIDPTGWVYIGGVKWESDVDGVVGYIKFRYNSGQVNVSITEGDAFDAYCEAVLISSEALIFGADPNES